MGYDERDPVIPRARVRLHLSGSRPGFVGGALLIVFGTLLFIDNLGFLPVSVFDAWGPLVFLGLGAWWFLRSNTNVCRIWSAALFVAGLLLVLDLFHIVKVTMATLWPLALIAAGAAMLVGRLDWGRLADRFSVASNTNTRPIFNRVQEVAVFSQVKRRIETQNFEGGELSSVFGGIEIDLRWAAISTPGKIAVLEANAAFGAVELRIPETWKISLQGSAVFGAYEDKTIPPRPEPGVETPTLVIKGGTAFGAVTVRN
jgi:predicted membrane protein